MQDGPGIPATAVLIGNPASARMLAALMAVPALTARELAREAGIALPDASAQLGRLIKAGLVASVRQGRHRYFRLSDADVALALESLMPPATRTGRARPRLGPSDPEMRRARSCYDHLAGSLAVTMFDRLVARGVLAPVGEGVNVTAYGQKYFAARGIDLAALARGRRALCRPCLDWSERRSHLGGTLGAALLETILAEGWAARAPGRRVVRFSPGGERAVEAWLERAAGQRNW